jgi:hypothetical protein
MTVTSTPAAPVDADARRGRRRPMPAVAAAVAVVALAAAVGGWLFVARQPSLVPGSLAAAGVVDGSATRTVLVSVRNAGPAPVTLVGFADDSVLTRPGGDFSPFSQARWGTAPEDLGEAPVRLARGQEAYVELGVRAPRCSGYVAGSALKVMALPLEVRSLGLTSRVDAPLGLPITLRFSSAHVPAADCP